MRLWINILLVAWVACPMVALEKRKAPLELTTSIVIPCHYRHFPFLEELLERYRQQTAIPNEIVVSLSESDQIPAAAIDSLENKGWPFVLKIIRKKQMLSAGANRNAACRASSKDLILCQDADDFPHPQRVEIVKFLFEQFEIDHLLHRFSGEEAPIASYKVEEIKTKCVYLETFNDTWTIPLLTFGNPAFRRYVFDEVQWNLLMIREEDLLFTGKVFDRFSQCAALDLVLYIYRGQFSISKQQ